jgi:hypothetical protein
LRGYGDGIDRPPETPAYKEAQEIALLLAEAKRSGALQGDAERRLRAYLDRIERARELALAPKVP